MEVEWYSEIPEDVGPFILISPDLETDLNRRLYHDTPVERRRLYMYLFDDPYYVWFRPNVELRGYVLKDLWDRCYQRPDPADLLEESYDSETGQAPESIRQQ